MTENRPAPPVSVVIPCYNAALTIRRALESARQQDYPALEIIAVDDGSTDDTRRILEAEGGRSVRVLALSGNHGAGAARNAGIEAATGEFVAFLDADDEWLPNKLWRQIEEIRDRPEMTMVACKARFVDLHGRTHEDLYRGLEPAEGTEAWRTLLAYNYIATPTVLARRSTLLAIGGFDHSLVLAEDQDLWIRLALAGTVGFVREPLVVVHAQSDSLSYRAALSLIDHTLPMIRRHFDAQRHRLSRAERRMILGHRFTNIGRLTYLSSPAVGLRLILRAVLLGHRPLENLLYLASSSPLALSLKRKLSRA